MPEDEQRAATLLTVLKRGKWAELEGPEILGIAQAWEWLGALKSRFTAAQDVKPKGKK